MVTTKNTIFVFAPTLPNQVANKAYVDSRSGGDLSFLARKEFESALFTVEGGRSATGDLVTRTAPVGKDMYLASAKISVSLDEASVIDRLVVTLNVNGTVIETYEATLHSNGTSSDNYEFAVKGVKVLAGEIIKLEVTAIDTATIQIEGIMVLFDVDTGVDPTT